MPSSPRTASDAAELERSRLQFEKMTLTPVPKLILGLAAPTILSMLITSIYNLADTFFVGQLSTSASGAVGVVSSLMAIIQALGFMLGHGAGGIISRSLGSQDTHAATKFASTSFFTALTFGAVLAVLGLATLPDFMMLLGSTDTILPHACAYARPILIAAPLMMSSLVMNNILRYEGKASFAMIGLVTGGVLNIVLDPVFIFGLGMGTGGAGTATALSQSISFCILLSMFLRGKTVSRFRITQVTRSARDFGQIFFNGAPSFGRQGLNSIGSMLLNVAARNYGDAARGRHEHRVPHLPVRAVGGYRRRTGPAACSGLQLRCPPLCPGAESCHLHHLDGFRLYGGAQLPLLVQRRAPHPPLPR